MEKFGWAYIGCGSIAHRTATELVQTEDNKIVAVWNRTRSKAEDFVKEYGGTVYDTAEEAINAPDVEGVYVNVNGDKHAEYTELSIKNKKPVLCEKPFTFNETETRKLFDYAKAEGVYISEAMKTWHNDTALTVNQWVESGSVGEIKSVACAYAFPMLEYSQNPRLTTPSMLGGALLDIGVYAVRYCYELFGLPEAIECIGDMHEVDHAEKITFQYPGFAAHIHISMVEDAGHFLEIKGSKGSISVPEFHVSKRAILTSADEVVTFEMDDLIFGRQFSNVAAEIRAGKKQSDYITPKSTIEVMGLLDECRRQMGLVYPQEVEKEQ